MRIRMVPAALAAVAGNTGYISKFVFDSVGNLQKQNMANANFKNIAY